LNPPRTAHNAPYVICASLRAPRQGSDRSKSGGKEALGAKVIGASDPTDKPERLKAIGLDPGIRRRAWNPTRTWGKSWCECARP